MAPKRLETTLSVRVPLRLLAAGATEGPGPAPILIGMHGYGQDADSLLPVLLHVAPPASSFSRWKGLSRPISRARTPPFRGAASIGASRRARTTIAPSTAPASPKRSSWARRARRRSGARPSLRLQPALLFQLPPRTHPSTRRSLPRDRGDLRRHSRRVEVERARHLSLARDGRPPRLDARGRDLLSRQDRSLPRAPRGALPERHAQPLRRGPPRPVGLGGRSARVPGGARVRRPDAPDQPEADRPGMKHPHRRERFQGPSTMAGCLSEGS